MSRSIVVLSLLILIFSTGVKTAEKISPSKVAFSTEFDGKLKFLNLAGGKIHELAVGGLAPGNLAYSAARHVLAFDGGENPDSRGSLYILHIKDLKAECIYKPAHGKPSLCRPQFDPKGRYLYAINYFHGIYRYAFSSRTWMKMRISGIRSLNPQGLSFAKSGKRVAISPGDFKGFYIAKVENGGFAVQKIVATNFLSCITPQWVGDEGIVFAGRKLDGPQYLWELNLISGRLVQITKPPMGTRDFLSLSKDERTIVFTGTQTNVQTQWDLWEVSIDGAGLRQLTHDGPFVGDLSPVWMQ